MDQNQHLGFIITINIAQSYKYNKVFHMMKTKFKNVAAAWFINLDQHWICMWKRNMQVYINKEQPKSQVYGPIIVAIVSRKMAQIAYSTI